MNGLEQPNTEPAEIERVLVRYLARRDYSRLELSRRLIAKGYAIESITKGIDELAEKGYQSDERFSEHFIRYRANACYGPFRVKQELREKGISSHLIEQSLQANNIDWFDLALRAKKKRFGTIVESDLNLRAKQVRYLKHRGFDQEHIQYAIFGE